MPDLHKGDRFPIGCAIASKGIYPALIGSDIGCGISVYPLGPKPSHLTPEKLALKLKRLDEPWEGDVKGWLKLYGIEKETEFDAGSLGTVGGGNHFAEIVTVERIVDEEACESMGVMENNLYLLGASSA
jgi:release factor H-coupled RctB family protein